MTLTELAPEELSQDLREGSSTFLKHRRAIVGLSLFSAGVMGGITLFQMGVFKKIPEPPSPLFDTALAGKLSIDQWTKYRAFCFWCLLTTGATVAALPLAFPEARTALRHLVK
ncbi:MAG: hypothetical protein JOZ32_02430 [Bryobacterales bacterium]|nr:hypothetical protein [Bryobacterales bacterium]